MFNLKVLLNILFLLSGVSYESVSGNEAIGNKLMRSHRMFLSKRALGTRQRVDEQLCEVQNNITTNTLTFVDASGKIPSGVLIGNVNDFGQYKQCLSVDELVDGISIRGKYCMMHVDLVIADDVIIPNEASLAALGGMSISGMVGMCVPNACSAPTLEQSAMTGFNITTRELFCRENNDKPWATEDFIAVVVFSILGLLALVSTCYHVYRDMFDNEDVSKLAKSFSIYFNMTNLTTVSKKVNPLDCINGIRVLSMAWVIVGHTFSTFMLGSVKNPLTLHGWFSTFRANGIFAAPLAVDTFFYVAGFLLTWSILKKFNNALDFLKAVPILYLNRYLRLTPSMAAVLLLQISVFHHISDGPDWRPVFEAKTNCVDNWWVTLLYAQNYVRPTEICLLHSWYLAVDLQFYLASPLLLIFLFGGMKRAVSALVVAIAGALGYSLGLCIYYNFDVSMRLDGIEAEQEYVRVFYYNSLARASPFVIGIMVAYIASILKRRNIEITNKLYKTVHWIATAGLLFGPYYGTYSTMHGDQNQLTINFFNAWHKPSWALGVGGIIVACMHGFGGPVNWLLSHDVWTVPARLSYAMYLIHYPIMFSSVASSTAPQHFSELRLIFRFVGELGVSYLAAVLLHLLVEAPFVELNNLLLSKLTGKAANKENQLGLKKEDKLQSASAIEEGVNDKNDLGVKNEGLTAEKNSGS